MKKTALLLILALALAGCNTLTEETSPLEDTPVTEEKPTQDAPISGNPIEYSIETPEGFIPHTINGFKYAFAYPDYYNVEGQGGTGVVGESLWIFNKKYADWKAIEGPAGINVHVLHNTAKKPLLTFLEEQDQYSNYGLKTNEGSLTTKNGYKAVTYQVSGLYEMDYYVFEHETYVYIFAASKSDDEKIEQKDLKTIIETLKFF